MSLELVVFINTFVGTVTKDHTVGSLSLKKGDNVFLDVKAANLDVRILSRFSLQFL